MTNLVEIRGLNIRLAGERTVVEVLNAEQELPANLRVFGRLGWNNGTTESYAYTEIDHTGEFGADMLVTLTNEGPATFILDSRDT